MSNLFASVEELSAAGAVDGGGHALRFPPAAVGYENILGREVHVPIRGWYGKLPYTRAQDWASALGFPDCRATVHPTDDMESLFHKVRCFGAYCFVAPFVRLEHVDWENHDGCCLMKVTRAKPYLWYALQVRNHLDRTTAEDNVRLLYCAHNMGVDLVGLRDTEGNSALHMAQTELQVEMLVHCGLNPNTLNCRGMTPMDAVLEEIGRVPFAKRKTSGFMHMLRTLNALRDAGGVFLKHSYNQRITFAWLESQVNAISS